MGECSLDPHARTYTHTCAHAHTSGDRGQLVLKDQINEVFAPRPAADEQKECEKVSGGNTWMFGAAEEDGLRFLGLQLGSLWGSVSQSDGTKSTAHALVWCYLNMIL